MPRLKRPLRALTAALGVIMAMAAFAGPASAAPYANQPTVSVSNQTPKAGGSFILSGSGFGAGEDVSNVLHSTPVTLTPAVADASGNFTVDVTLPAGVTGVHTITSTGATTGRTASVSITIAAGTTTSNAAPTAGLAFTGAAVTGIIALGVLLLAGGGLMLFSSRRRKVAS